MIKSSPTASLFTGKLSVFNRDNTRLAVIQAENTVVLFQLPTMHRLADIQHRQPVRQASFSPEANF